MSQENVELVTSVLEQWGRGDFGSCAPLLASDIFVTWQEPAGTTVCHGAIELSQRFRAFIEQWDDFRAEVEEVEEVGKGNVLVVTHQEATGRRSGIGLDARGYIVFGLRDGRVASLHWYFDRDKALEAAGLTE